MSSVLDAEIVVNSGLENRGGNLPFSLPSNLEVLCKNYGLETIGIDLKCDGELDWAGLFFNRSIGNRLHIFSGGRFGYAGFSQVGGRHPLGDYMPMIESCLGNLKPATCCLTGSFLDEYGDYQIPEGWNLSEIRYLVADIAKSVDESGLSFRNAKRRSNLSRNLKRAKNLGYKCRMSTKTSDLQKWHAQCHLVRIEELGGRQWDYELLSHFLNAGSGKLAIAEDSEGNILGGCVVLCSRDVLELFMMSTPREYLNKGINYILAEFLYRYAFDNGINYVNWQASNPPVGPLVDFKKSWNATEMCFPVFSKIWDTGVTREYLEKEFKDCYVFPFTKLLGNELE